MEALNSWERLEKNVGKGVLVQYREKTPYEKIMDIGRAIKTREKLEKAKVGVPKYSKAEKKKIKKDVQRYFNLLEKKYGKR
jgi:ubiquitin